MKRFFLLSLFYILILGGTLATLITSSYGQVDEREIKAEWIYIITSYTKWVGNTDKDRVICTVGREGVHAFLKDVLLEKQAKGHEKDNKIRVERRSTQSNFENCHILYISLSESNHINGILKNIYGKQILTISSLKEFVSKGGMVELVNRDDGVVSLYLNLNAIEKAKITIDDNIVNISTTTYGE